jgi:hypothetical protein
MVIFRLIFCDGCANKRARQGTRSGPEGRAPSMTGGGTADECSGSRTGQCADASSLARRRFTRAKKERDKNGGHTRRKQMFVHNFRFSFGFEG